jgi:hypothetical protein
MQSWVFPCDERGASGEAPRPCRGPCAEAVARGERSIESSDQGMRIEVGPLGGSIWKRRVNFEIAQ